MARKDQRAGLGTSKKTPVSKKSVSRRAEPVTPKAGVSLRPPSTTSRDSVSPRNRIPAETPRKASPRRPPEALPAGPRKAGDESASTVTGFVGIGASAGGLEALEGFISHLPPDSGLVFVVVQHLSASGHKSLMGALLQKHTAMRIFAVEDGVRAEPNTIYLNPAGKDVSIVDGTFHLSEPEGEHFAHRPIDHFFQSLAEDQKKKAVGIVLSGTGTDGTIGIRAIKAAGGLSVAQEESQAKYGGMPRSAADTGMVDLVLPVEKMAESLRRYIGHSYLKEHVESVPGPSVRMDTLRQVEMAIRTHTGHDFSGYKPTTIWRRIERRMALHQIDRTADYVQMLRGNESEVKALYKDMLIGVTSFFRDHEAFELLEEKVLPTLLQGRPLQSPFRIWVPGCSTGEEAYSLAILVQEAMESLGRVVPVQIFATDADPGAVDFARKGVFPQGIEANVSNDRLSRFFYRRNDRYEVSKRVRETVVFAVQNLIKDPPFLRLDLVSCRNLLIYLGADLQKKIIPLFHYVLSDKGYLLLGTSEGIGGFADLFAPVSTRWKIFRKKSGSSGKWSREQGTLLFRTDREPRQTEERRVLTETSKQRLAEQVILQDYAPACVLIDEKQDIIYFHGKTEPYLVPAQGEPSFHLSRMARPELVHKLDALLQKAYVQKKPVTAKGLRVEYRGGYITFDLVVRPVVAGLGLAGWMMVVFDEKKAPAASGTGKARGKRVEGPVPYEQTEALKWELQSTKEYLQTTIEELETSGEEMKATNEELQSTNEELQSSNEELETSREELQSTNEELETVNSELQSKLEQLLRVNTDLNNILTAANIGTIFLDLKLAITRFTPLATKIFNLRESDIGRPISDITARMDSRVFQDNVRAVLDTLMPNETDIKTPDDEWFSVRIHPYRTEYGAVDGVVVTFVETSRLKHDEARFRRLATVVNDSNDAITVADLEGKILAWNRGAARIYGYSEAEALQMNIQVLVPADRVSEWAERVHEIASGREVASFETLRKTRDGQLIKMWLTVTRLTDEQGHISGLATTERKIPDEARADVSTNEA